MIPWYGGIGIFLAGMLIGIMIIIMTNADK